MAVEQIQVRDLVEDDVFSHDDGENWLTVIATEPAGYETIDFTVVYTDEGEVDLGSEDFVYVKRKGW